MNLRTNSLFCQSVGQAFLKASRKLFTRNNLKPFYTVERKIDNMGWMGILLLTRVEKLFKI
jgi:hypothetical protein